MIYDDFYDHTIKEIRRACTDALARLGFSWKASVSFPILNTLTGRHEWQINLFDEDWQPLFCVGSCRSPEADEYWFRQEIIRQIRGKLTTVKQ